MTVTIMAAVARNGVIGRDNALPWRLRGDLKRLKETTMGHVLVMGRRTYESIGRPLPGRTTIVVTRQRDWQPAEGLPAGLHVAPDVPTALSRAEGLDDQTFVFGGAEVYAETLPVADRLMITWVDAEPEGDAYFPAVEWDEWSVVSTESLEGCERLIYERRQPR
ncbi:MAG: dihydrofolate reductase [Nocardioidaceae bacterium]